MKAAEVIGLIMVGVTIVFLAWFLLSLGSMSATMTDNIITDKWISYEGDKAYCFELDHEETISVSYEEYEMAGIGDVRRTYHDPEFPFLPLMCTFLSGIFTAVFWADNFLCLSSPVVTMEDMLKKHGGK